MGKTLDDKFEKVPDVGYRTRKNNSFFDKARKSMLIPLLIGLSFYLTACDYDKPTITTIHTPEPAKVEEVPEIVTYENISNVTSDLNKVQTWLYFLGFDIEPAIDEIIDSDYDMVVIEPIFTEKENQDFDKEIINKIKNSAGANVENKIVIAYIDIGQAESFRYYWRDGWEIGDPRFIVGEDPDLWEECYPVAFWDNTWQDIWFRGVDGYDAQLKMIIDAGFDGVYLDWVEAYSDYNVMEQAENEGINAVEEMKNFVKKIGDYGTGFDPDFIVISQNAAELCKDDDYVSTIDAIAQEQVWFDGGADGNPEGDCPLPATDEDIETEEYEDSLSKECLNTYFDLPEGTLHVSSEEYIDYLNIAKDKGLIVFTVDYAIKERNINYAYTESKKLGFIPFVSNRELNQFVEPMDS
ncbi:MAG: hypothetical protein GY861_09285 [bacterium]|nr:hypothetical protein [bacterium]